jgi:nucleotide-binding universal stress UspA family protein
MRQVVVGASGRADDRSLDFALTEAIRRRLPLLVVGVYQAPAYGEAFAGPLPDRLRELREACRRQTAEALAQAQARVPAALTAAVTALLQEGDTAARLLAAAESAALLVVGSPTGGVLGHAMRGSVAWTCLQRLSGPLAVVPHGVELVADRWLRSRVLVGLDGSPASVSALTWAVAQAREWGCVLVPVVVSADDDHPPAGLRGSGPDLTAQVWKQVLEAGGSDVEAHPRFLVGEHKHQLLQLAEPSDLLVVGSRHRAALPTLLAGAPVALRCRCPVVVVPEGQARREIHQRRAQPLLL